MAGGHGHGYTPVKYDPAIDKWAHMREHVYEHFKFTPKNTRALLFVAGAVPFFTYLGCTAFNRKYDVLAPPRDQSMLAKPLAPPRSSSSA
ncbi:hypothetical protein BCR39DRAFT_544657 [Naematelia encephala]|uniref:NADH dehydrogenase [ubiquinone] 1 beta subcomplex subunit 4 n=1 Tax=Naematelia encephala TaxID=71784 RepID=A0A1Y2AS00_9TREE|nr:hypothetical protein BCR39DRAFT_544657 [Naematelia encephala]